MATEKQRHGEHPSSAGSAENLGSRSSCREWKRRIGASVPRLHNRDGHSTVPWFEELREDPTLPADLLASGSSAPLAFPFQYVVLEQWLERSQLHERSVSGLSPVTEATTATVSHRLPFSVACPFPTNGPQTPEGVFKKFMTARFIAVDEAIAKEIGPCSVERSAALATVPTIHKRECMNDLATHDRVILVDELDREIGTALKLPAHESGALHRAFSIFVWDSNNRVMLQRRALEKYHSGGLWTNTCCSHPRPGENTDAAAHRRLQEEMGFDCPLKHAFHFIYRAELDHGLTEHEFDHVYLGTYDGAPILNKEEACDWRWIGADALDAEIVAQPETFTVWFKIAWAEYRRREYLIK